MSLLSICSLFVTHRRGKSGANAGHLVLHSGIDRMRKYSWLPFLAIYMLAVLVGITTTKSPQPITASEVVKKAEAERLATIRKVKQASVCVFVKEGNNILGGGSGVLIDKDGYCLTNYHVVAGQGFTGFRPTFVCSLPNGQMYDAVTVGTDKVGDVALIKLFPNKEGEEFPFVEMCDSDQIRPGEWSIIIGNPSLLATDFDPSISFGLISGVNRYRDFGFAEHTDALQYDTAANKGNSGGPIFNLKGELMGLVFGGNSVKRGSMNNGVGYGIPVNKIKNFLGHLRSGNACDHATLGATVASEGNDEAELPKMLVNAVMDDSDAARRGIGEGDLLLSFAGRPLLNANTFKSALGIYPKEWRLPITFQKGKTRKETLVRLMSYTPQEVSPGPKKGPLAPPPKAFGKGAQFFEAKPGFVNYYFNRQERDRLLAGSRKLADMREAKGDWLMVGTYASEARNGDFSAKIFLEDDKYAATLQMGLTDYKVVPAIPNQSIEDISESPFSGGLAMSLLYYRRFLTK
ncbi:MAG: trypsin-like peptidase domain-containing protein [Zavarzinella sp.]